MGEQGWRGVHPQRSLEDEINRTTAQDLPIFGVSYIVIFLYIALALGSYSSWRRVPVRIRGWVGGEHSGVACQDIRKLPCRGSPRGNASWRCPALGQAPLEQTQS